MITAKFYITLCLVKKEINFINRLLIVVGTKFQEYKVFYFFVIQNSFENDLFSILKIDLSKKLLSMVYLESPSIWISNLEVTIFT